MKKINLMIVTIVILAIQSLAQATTPGSHSVTVSLPPQTQTGVTYNLYKGTATGVCSGTPTPYKTGLATPNFTDNTVTNGSTYFYAFAAVGTGGISTCTPEVSVQIPVPPAQPTGTPTATVN